MPHAFLILVFVCSMLLHGSGEHPKATVFLQQDDKPAATRPATSQPDGLADATEEYASILKAVVTDDGLVRYDMLHSKDLRKSLDDVIRAFADTTMPESKNEKLAFLSNAYNANVLANVRAARQQPGFENVLKVDGFFDKALITVAGIKMTLNDLENNQIRPLGDARIHAALVCAAMSCPPLRNEPFLAFELDKQFDDQCRRWVQDSSKNTVQGNRLLISSIFDWYGEDFKIEPWNSVERFLKHYDRPGGPFKQAIGNVRAAEISWMAYDWGLNIAPKTAER